MGIAKIYRKVSKRKQIKKQKKESWKESETNSKFYEQSEQGNDEEDDSCVQRWKYGDFPIRCLSGGIISYARNLSVA